MAEGIHLLIRVAEQRLYVLNEQQQVMQKYSVSTSKYGVGNKEGSLQTPTGKHCVKQKIGGQAAVNEVFVGRKSIGVLDELHQQSVSLPEDIISSRIIWLQGLQAGVNQGADIDSYRRYIYIHGTSEEDKIGTAASHGCIRMRNKDVIQLFDLLEVGCLVEIVE
jgi:lipoprotein-anchoring transpeptidase ErfK/SrfK